MGQSLKYDAVKTNMVQPLCFKHLVEIPKFQKKHNISGWILGKCL